MNNSIAERMKGNYEDRYRIYLTRRTPVIIRVDGQAFHTLTRRCQKPFDYSLMDAMAQAALSTSLKMQGFKICYVQSDEASFLLTDYDDLNTEAWFDYNLSKITSITASTMSVNFYLAFNGLIGLFDCRAFNIPKEEVSNYFLWRAQDWERNSLMMYCQSFFSHKELYNKSHSEQHEMLHSIGKNWADLPDYAKNGTFITRKGTFRVNIQANFADINLLVEDQLAEIYSQSDNNRQ